MKVFIVKEQNSSKKYFTNINEGLGKVLRYGAYSKDVLERLRYLNGEFSTVVGNALSELVAEKQGVDLKTLIAQAIHMGDECHNRNVAATSLLFRELAPYFVRVTDRQSAEKAFRTIDGNNHFFVNLAMAACKAMAE
jgi:hypothetical protein